MSKDILIVDDEKDIRSLIRGILEDEGFSVREAANSASALKAVSEKVPDLMILDIWLQDSDHDGIEVLKTVKKDNDILPVLMISGHGTIETAVTAIKHGAYDFIEKPFKSDRLLMMISRALETASLKQENKALKARRDNPDSELIGKSAAIKNLTQQIKKIAPTNSRVLITGEAGTGKEVVARMLHKLSERSDKAFMVLNCAALHPERLEEELFGSQLQGQNIKGVMELAHGGTLLLDEVGDMPLETQGKILRALQDNKFHPVGSNDEIEVDVRIIAASNQKLPEKIKQGSFREDLYYRLNVMTLEIPPLAKRNEDVLPLAEFFLNHFATQAGRSTMTLSKNVVALMQGYGWPGNVRQLRNVMEWITIMRPSSKEGEDVMKIEEDHLPPEINGKAGASDSNIQNVNYYTKSLRDAREAFEKDYLTQQVKRFQGNIAQTAEFIGMERSALHRKLKSLDINSLDISDEAPQNEGQDLDQSSSSQKRA